MKKIQSYFRILYILFAGLLVTSCVHDDIYSEPNMANYQCEELTPTMTLAAVKALTQNATITTDDVIEGYVSSSDETGNIYKYIYIQDKPENPTQGLTVSVDAVSTYMNYPQGSKVYIKLKGLAVGKYGNFVQLGAMDATGVFGRIPEQNVPTNIKRSCTAKSKIVPKVMTLAQMSTANDQYVGCLVQVNNAEFASKVLCSTYADPGVSVDKQINDATSSTTTKIVRNSGYASFAADKLPSGNGTFVGVLSKYNSTYQMYINRTSDLSMTGNRLDGIPADPCSPASGLTLKTIAEAKQLYSGALTQITGDFMIKGKVTANDETGNLYKYVYVEDATGGIRVNINKTNLYQDARFKVGKELIISLKNLYIGNVNGELQLGQPFSGNVGQIAEVDVYKFFFDSGSGITPVVPTERTISQLTTADVGRWIKIKDLQFINADLGKPYAAGTTTNRTLENCSGQTILLRTSNFASFAGTEIDGGKGDVYAILSYYAPTNQYQLWITNLLGADLDNARCDGTIPPKTIFNEGFSGALTDNWTTKSVTGAQIWNIQNFGNPAPCVVMNGFSGTSQVNEDWMVSKAINLSGYTSAYFSFDSDVRYTGNAIEVMVTKNYTGDPATTTWTAMTPVLDTNSAAFNTWTSSGSLNLNAFVGQNVYIAFKYTSTATAAATWEIDNIKVKGN